MASRGLRENATVEFEGEDRTAAIRITGLGSMPGIDPAEASRIVVGELDVPHLIELPARGPGADMLGRTLALVARSTGEFGAETTPTGWRLAGGRTGAQLSRPMRRGAAWLGEDADRLEELLGGYAGDLKVQVAGPWTLAAGVEAPNGARLLADHGACADVSGAVAEALAGHVVAMRRRVPGARIVVQVDEPALPAVLAGRIRTASGRGVLRTPDLSEVVDVLGTVVAAARGAGAAEVVAHCCAGDPPFEGFRRSGFSGVAVDLAALGVSADEALGAWWDRGGAVLLGVLPSVDPPPTAAARLAEGAAHEVAGLWRRIGFPVATVAGRTRLSPGCGLAGASPEWARRVGGILRESARMLESAD